MLPFVMLPRPLQESNVVGKGGTAGFLGKAYDPYTLYPDGDDMDMTKMDRIKVDDLKLRPEVFALRLQRRAKLRDAIERRHAARSTRPSPTTSSTSITTGPSSLIVSGRARDAFNLAGRVAARPATCYGRNTFGQSCLLARRLVEAGTQGRRGHLAQGGQLRQPFVGPPRRPDQPDAGPVGPDARPGPLRPARPTWTSAACSNETLVVAVGEFGRSPQKGVSTSGNGNSADGRDHWPYCYTAVVAGAGITPRLRPRQVRQDRLGPARPTRSTPASCWPRSTTRFGIDPATIVYNHLNQPRELVKADAVTRLFA